MEKVIYNAQNEVPEKWNRINENLNYENANYIKEHGQIGTKKWWDCYQNGKVVKKVIEGTVNFIGIVEDELGHRDPIISIQTEDGLSYDFDHFGSFKNNNIKLGTIISYEYAIVEVKGRYGSYRVELQMLVKIIN